MKIYNVTDNNLQFDTEGWIKFGDFMKGVMNYVNEHKIYDTGYELNKNEITDIRETTIELGAYITADHSKLINRNIAYIGITQMPSVRCDRKREFSILGVDFSEAVYICSIPKYKNTQIEL